MAEDDEQARETAIKAALRSGARHDLARLRADFERWLARAHPAARVLSMEIPAASGASSELFLLRLAGFEADEAVLKLAPAHSVYPVVDLGLQARCMTAAARGPAPVPRVFACETDAAAIGAAFLLMERRHGRGAPDWPSYVLEGWIRDLAPAEQEMLWWNGLEAIAAFHATPVDGLGADFHLPAPGATPLSRMLAYWQLFLARIEEEGDYPLLRQAVDYLVREQPADALATGLVWGDASLRNMLFDGLRPAALLDFEFAHLGLPAFDVVFYALMDYVMAAGFAGGAPRLPGFPGVGDTLDRYEAITGTPIRARGYLQRMSLTYNALATTRVFQRLAAQGRIPREQIAPNPPALILREVFESGRLPLD